MDGNPTLTDLLQNIDKAICAQGYRLESPGWNTDCNDSRHYAVYEKGNTCAKICCGVCSPLYQWRVVIHSEPGKKSFSVNDVTNDCVCTVLCFVFLLNGHDKPSEEERIRTIVGEEFTKAFDVVDTQPKSSLEGANLV